MDKQIEIKKAIYIGYGNDDAHYKCPYCGDIFGGWIIFFQKREGEKPHCPHCNKPLIVGD